MREYKAAEQNISFKASCIERAPPIWYRGLRPLSWLPLPSEAPSIWVDRPNTGDDM